MSHFSFRYLALLSLFVLSQHFCSVAGAYSSISAPECGCGGWNEEGFAFTTTWQGLAAKYVTENKNQGCGNTYINVDSNATISFSSGGFICYGNSACTSQIKWSVIGGDASPSSGIGYPDFTINGTGTYELRMYGSCSGSECDSCIFTYIAMKEDCDCGQWLPFTINMGNDTALNQSCGASYFVEKEMPVTIRGLYDCSGTDSCDAGYRWLIKKNNVFFMEGTGLPILFTPTEAGEYVVEIDPSCKGHDCSACQFMFVVQKDPVQTGIELTDLIENGDVAIEMNISPNPARDLITLRLSSEKHEAGMISWYNELGIIVKQIYVEWNGGEKLLEINSQDLAAGIYFVRFNGVNGRPLVKVSVYH